MFQRRKQKGTKLPPLGAETFEIILLQKLFEERLHQIFRIFSPVLQGFRQNIFTLAF